MDFFEEQALARKRTVRLAVLFAVAVVGVMAAVYVLSLAFYVVAVRDATGIMYMTGKLDHVSALGFNWWNPGVFAFACGSTALVVGLGALYKTAQLRDGGAAVALGLGGRKVDPDSTKLEERRLLNVVEEMAIASGIPAPEVYVLDREPGINAFAAGKTTSDAVIGVTHGTVQLLNRQELQGVIAHELSHILNGDSRINLRAIGLLHGIFLLALIGRFLIRGATGSGNGPITYFVTLVIFQSPSLRPSLNPIRPVKGCNRQRNMPKFSVSSLPMPPTATGSSSSTI